MTFACVWPTTKRGCALYLYVYVSRVCVDALVRSALQYIDEDVYSLISNEYNFIDTHYLSKWKYILLIEWQ